MLPHEFPNNNTVNWHYNNWRRDGRWDKIMIALRDAVRQTVGKETAPTVACIESQAAETADQWATWVTTA